MPALIIPVYFARARVCTILYGEYAYGTVTMIERGNVVWVKWDGERYPMFYSPNEQWRLTRMCS
jgi:hypothetical protein